LTTHVPIIICAASEKWKTTFPLLKKAVDVSSNHTSTYHVMM